MKRLVIPVLLVTATIVGCGQKTFDSHAYLQDGGSGFYRITNQRILNVGNQCGEVSSGEDPLQMSGWYSNVLQSGTQLFLIPNESISPPKEIAVELKNNYYVLAVYVGGKKP